MYRIMTAQASTECATVHRQNDSRNFCVNKKLSMADTDGARSPYTKRTESFKYDVELQHLVISARRP